MTIAEHSSGKWLELEKNLYFLTKYRHAAPLTNPVEFLKDNYPGQNLFRYVQSQPNIAHMRGLVELREAGIEILQFWDTNHNLKPEFENEADRREWGEYEELRSGKRCPVLRLNRGETSVHDPERVEDEILVLSPTPDLTQTAHESQCWNNLSYVLKINSGFSFLLPGNIESPVWDDLLNHCKSDLKSLWLKASHQGRDVGVHEEAFQAISPLSAIVSLGSEPVWSGKNKYSQHGIGIDSLRLKGNRTFVVDDHNNIKIQVGFP